MFLAPLKYDSELNDVASMDESDDYEDQKPTT
jgi:hypothetical protein